MSRPEKDLNAPNRPESFQTLTIPRDIDDSLLRSSLPEGTELRQANNQLKLALRNILEIFNPIRRYTDRLIRIAETQNNDLIIAQRDLKESQELFNRRRKRKKGKRVELESRFVFSTQEVLDVAIRIESEQAKKKRKRPKKKGPKRTKIIEDLEDEYSSESDPIESDYDKEVMSAKKKFVGVVI